MAIKWIGSPNKDKGREGYRPEAIVIHIIKTRIDVNIRELAPTTTAPIVRTAKHGKKLSYQGWTSNGLTVNGNAHWYKDSDGNYFWAGATERPIPGL